MKLIEMINGHAIMRLDKNEGFETIQNYMVIYHYDKNKDYCSLDGDVYKETLMQIRSIC